MKDQPTEPGELGHLVRAPGAPCSELRAEPCHPTVDESLTQKLLRRLETIDMRLADMNAKLEQLIALVQAKSGLSRHLRVHC